MSDKKNEGTEATMMGLPEVGNTAPTLEPLSPVGPNTAPSLDQVTSPTLPPVVTPPPAPAPPKTKALFGGRLAGVERGGQARIVDDRSQRQRADPVFSERPGHAGVEPAERSDQEEVHFAFRAALVASLNTRVQCRQ